MDSENMLVEFMEGGVVLVKINRPKKMNAFTFEMFGELREVVNKICNCDKDVRVIVLS